MGGRLTVGDGLFRKQAVDYTEQNWVCRASGFEKDGLWKGEFFWKIRER